MGEGKLQVLDIFSGIGGFSLGLERAGMETVAFCEIEEYPRKVLKKHWPEVPCYEDVTKLTGDILKRDGISVDVITGGFPCQDISTAGKQKGMGEGTRSGLWSEIVRLTSDIRPRYVIVENVANLLNGPVDKPGAWFSRILADLAGIGYDAEWENIPASFVGAVHRRERIWIIAYPSEVRRSAMEDSDEGKRSFSNAVKPSILLAACKNHRVQIPDCEGEPALLKSYDGFPIEMAGLGACGNSVVPQIPEMIGRAIISSGCHE